jgi:hypothetical protein
MGLTDHAARSAATDSANCSTAAGVSVDDDAEAVRLAVRVSLKARLLLGEREQLGTS